VTDCHAMLFANTAVNTGSVYRALRLVRCRTEPNRTG